MLPGRVLANATAGENTFDRLLDAKISAALNARAPEFATMIKCCTRYWVEVVKLHGNAEAEKALVAAKNNELRAKNDEIDVLKSRIARYERRLVVNALALRNIEHAMQEPLDAAIAKRARRCAYTREWTAVEALGSLSHTTPTQCTTEVELSDSPTSA